VGPKGSKENVMVTMRSRANRPEGAMKTQACSPAHDPLKRSGRDTKEE